MLLTPADRERLVAFYGPEHHAEVQEPPDPVLPAVHRARGPDGFASWEGFRTCTLTAWKRQPVRPPAVTFGNIMQEIFRHL